MKWFEPKNEYAYEKRGNNWYGFCDSGCKVIVRPNMRSLRTAMDQHHAAHHGQMRLEIPAPPAWPDDGSIPF